MLSLLYEGGPLFMGLITIVFFIMLVVAYINGMPALRNEGGTSELHRRRIGYIKSLGLLALVIGVLAQLIGLYSAFAAMSTMDGGISTPMLAGGLKVSTIPTLYGLVVFAISYVIWLIFSWRMKG